MRDRAAPPQPGIHRVPPPPGGGGGWQALRECGIKIVCKTQEIEQRRDILNSKGLADMSRIDPT